MEYLTKTEEKIMHILWESNKAFVNDVIEKMPDPKPPYNTISSVIRILEKKGFVTYKAYGRTHEYFPIITKSEYKRFTFKSLIKDYFDDSYKDVVSFMMNETDLTQEEIEDLKSEIQNINGGG